MHVSGHDARPARAGDRSGGSLRDSYASVAGPTFGIAAGEPAEQAPHMAGPMTPPIRDGRSLKSRDSYGPPTSRGTVAPW